MFWGFFSFRMPHITQGGPKTLAVLVVFSLCFWITKHSGSHNSQNTFLIPVSVRAGWNRSSISNVVPSYWEMCSQAKEHYFQKCRAHTIHCEVKFWILNQRNKQQNDRILHSNIRVLQDLQNSNGRIYELFFFF